MSRDSNYNFIHFIASHHSDLFEEFCSSNSNQSGGSATTTSQSNAHGNANQPSDPEMVHIPGHFLPFEEIRLPQHLMPVNPEDEDDVVPDMHAAFGIQSALGQNGGVGLAGASGEAGSRGAAREPVWRDLGMERLLETGGAAAGAGSGSGGVSGRNVKSEGVNVGSGGGGRREGRRNPVLLMR